MKKTLKLTLLFLFLISVSHAQVSPTGMIDINDDDMKVGGDIFSDFNEDLDASHIIEDERFYRYGRFFSAAVSLGMTAFNGNRGLAYENEHPTFGMSLQYFQNFRSAFGLGFTFSKHHMFLADSLIAFQDFEGADKSGPGFVSVNMFRVYFSYRYYMDTSNLGTAITYSNPYIIGRVEYWYQTNKFIDQPEIGDDNGGAFGFAVGGGLEFPLKLKETYLGLEMLMHSVAFFDKYTLLYKGVTPGTGYDDLTGYGFTTMISYITSW